MSLFSRDASPLPFDSFREEFSRRVLAGEGDSILYVVPNRVAKNRLEREILERSSAAAISSITAHTFDDLAAALFASAFPAVRVLSDAESATFVEEAIRELLQDGRLQYFEQPRIAADADALTAFPLPRGTFELITNTLRRLAKTGITYTRLTEDIQQLESRAPGTIELRRAKDIACICAGYLERLGERFIDRSHLVTRLLSRYQSAEFLDRDFQRSYSKAEFVLIEDHDVLDPPVVALLAQLAQLARVRTVIRTRSGNNRTLFAAVDRLEEQLLGAGLIRFGETASSKESRVAEVLADSLFSEENRVSSDVQNVVVRCANDPTSEVQSIAREIKQLCADNPALQADLGRIVVATPNAEEYTPLFREIFAQFGIPVFIADRFHLDRSPLMQGVFALFDVARFGPRRTAVSRLFSNPYFRFERPDGTAIDVKNLRAVLARHQLSGDFRQVQNRLKGVIDAAKQRLTSSEATERDLARDLDECQRAASDLRDLASITSVLAAPLRPSEFRSALSSVFDKLGVRTALLSNNDKTIAAGMLEADVRAYTALFALLEDLESLFALLHYSDRKLPLSFYVERLRAAAIWTRYNPRPVSLAVQVLSLEQSVDQPADYLFLAGLQEGYLPRPYQPQVFLMQTHQAGEQKQLSEERLAFYRAVCNFSERLFLSYCAKSATGRDALPSPFVTELMRRLGLNVDVLTRNQTAVYSYSDLYRQYAPRSADDTERQRLLTEARLHSPFGFYRDVLEARVPHSIDVERLREAGEPSIYNGYLDKDSLEEEERRTLEQNSERVWSVSQLELYGKCGFQYFLRNVLRLEGLEEETEGLEATERGILLHEVLRRFMTQRRADDRPVREAPMEEALGELHDLAREYLDTYSVDHPFWRLDSETLLQDRRSAGGVFARFLEKENFLIKSEMRPAYFEVAFGMPPDTDCDPLLVVQEEITVDGLRLRGKIDRIDTSEHHFAVVDYKSGATVSQLKQIKRGISLQLPLYLRVAEDVLRCHMPHLVGVAGIYHKLCDPKSQRQLGIAVKEYAKTMYPDVERQRMVDSIEELQELIAAVVERAKLYVQGISNGAFPLVEEDLVSTVCTVCEYSSICRVTDAERFGVLRQPVPIVSESSEGEDVDMD